MTQPFDPYQHGQQQAPAPGWAPPGQVPDPRQWQQVPPYGAYPPPPAPLPPMPKKRRTWPWIVGAIVLLFVVIGVANGGDRSNPSAAPGCGSTSGCATVPNLMGKTRSAASSAIDEAGFTGGRDEFNQVPVYAMVIAQQPQPGTAIGKTDSINLTFSTEASAAAPAVAAPAPAVTTGPLTTIVPGTYEVGNGDGQVVPGKYKSPNPGGYCYSARLKNNDGALGDIIANDIHQGQALLTVKASDGYVEVTGCTFVKTD